MLSRAAMTLRLTFYSSVFFAIGVTLGGCGGGKKALKERQDQAEYHYDLAYGYYFDSNKANADAAMLEVQHSLDLNEENPDAHLLAGLIFMGRMRYLDAERHFKRALQLKPDFRYAKNNLGATYLAMERWDDAIKLFEALVADVLYARPGHGHNNLGWAWFQKGDMKRARRHFMTAIQLAPKLCQPYNNLAMVYSKQEQYERAKKYLERAIKHCANYAEPHYHLGRLHIRRGEVGDARDQLQKCLKLAGETRLGDKCGSLLSSLPPVKGRR